SSVTVTFFVSACVEAIVPVVTPLALVRPGWTNVLLLPLEARLAAAPGSALLWASTTVTVTVETAVPLATTLVVGLADALDSVALIVLMSPMNPTVGTVLSTTAAPLGSSVTVKLLVSACVEAIVPEVTPLALVAPGWTSVLLLPLDA